MAIAPSTPKAGWEVKTLGEACEMYQPKTISKKEMDPNGEYPVFGANGIIGRYSKFNHEDPELLITCRGATCGAVNVTVPRSWINGNAMVVRPKSDSLKLTFLKYLFTGGHLVEEAISGAAQPQITRTSLNPLQIPVPPLAEQDRIVGILDEAFEGIATATAQAEKNLHNARELFQSVLQSTFSQKGDDWEETTLGEVCENLDSKRIPITKNKRVAGEVPYYGASGIVDHVAEHIFDEDLLLVSEDGANLLARTYPIAFSISGKTWVNNHAHVLKFEEMAAQHFVEFYLNSIKLDPYVSGMAQPKLNQKSLNSIPVPSPPLPTQQAIVEKLDALSEETKALEAIYECKQSALAELKQSLLQKAFAGEL